MEKKSYNTFNLGGQSLHFINKENNPGIGTENTPITSFGMATKNRSIKVVQKIGVNNYYDADEENLENIPLLIKGIKRNNNII